MRKTLGFFSGVLLAVIAAMLMAPSGGFPSRPRFQTATITAAGTSTLPTVDVNATRSVLRLRESDAAADNRIWTMDVDGERLIFRATSDIGGGPTDGWLAVDRTGSTVDIIALTVANATRVTVTNPSAAQSALTVVSGDTVGDAFVRFQESDVSTQKGYVGFGGAANDTLTMQNDENGANINLVTTGVGVVQANGVDIASQSSGTFTASFDVACTTTPTLVFDWVRAGNMVTLVTKAPSGFPCTSDSTSFATTGAPVPAAIRPAVTISSGNLYSNFVNNGTNIYGCFLVSSAGDIQFTPAATFGTQCQAGSWTGSGSKSATPAQSTFTYILTDP